MNFDTKKYSECGKIIIFDRITNHIEIIDKEDELKFIMKALIRFHKRKLRSNRAYMESQRKKGDEN